MVSALDSGLSGLGSPHAKETGVKRRPYGPLGLV